MLAHTAPLAEDRDSIRLIERMFAAGRPVAAVCHAPGVLRHAQAASGAPLVQGKKVAGFTNTEEAASYRATAASRLGTPSRSGDTYCWR